MILAAFVVWLKADFPISRRDGSPFANLLMVAPLCDSRGNVRYFIGAQVDVSGLVEDCIDLESFRRLVEEQDRYDSKGIFPDLSGPVKKDEFQELSKMLNADELETVRRCGGHMHTVHQVNRDDVDIPIPSRRPQLLLDEGSVPEVYAHQRLHNRASGRLSGIYQHGSFRILCRVL